LDDIGCNEAPPRRDGENLAIENPYLRKDRFNSLEELLLAMILQISKATEYMYILICRGTKSKCFSDDDDDDR
jgi:hypothetical protein